MATAFNLSKKISASAIQPVVQRIGGADAKLSIANIPDAFVYITKEELERDFGLTIGAEQDGGGYKYKQAELAKAFPFPTEAGDMMLNQFRILGAFDYVVIAPIKNRRGNVSIVMNAVQNIGKGLSITDGSVKEKPMSLAEFKAALA